MNTVYDRETLLRSDLNNFFIERLGLPADDYYSKLDQQSLYDLKSVLSDINNIFTLKISLQFVHWLGDTLMLSAAVVEQIRNSILRTPPNANGYDVAVTEPIPVIAEVKCNLPINGKDVFGANQRDNIARDIKSLICGKNRSTINPETYLKFMVLLDTEEVRRAMIHFVKNMKEYKDVIVFSESGIKPNGTDKVHVVYIKP